MLTRTMPDDGPRELNSWKEIAAHLQVTVRTAQEWEKKRGLPVRRVPGGRGRVFVRLDELEAWLTQDGVSSAAVEQAQGEPTSASQVSAAVGMVAEPERAWLPWVAIAGASLALLLAIAAVIIALEQDVIPAQPLAPSAWRVVEDTLIVTDEGGEPAWRREFEENLNERSYEVAGTDAAEFIDLEGDGDRELLFIAYSVEHAAPNPLICFDERGNELWRFTPSASVRTATEAFEDLYHVASFMPIDLSNGDRVILVSSIHYMFYPTQLALISATDGSLLGEYWHAGHIGTKPGDHTVGDRNQDGRPELYAGGVSNSHTRATLVILELEDLLGVSVASVEENPAYQFQGFGEPEELARILFPRSSMNLALGRQFNHVGRVWLTPELINVNVVEDFLDEQIPGLIYQLSADFAFHDVKSNTAFDGVHNRMLREGVLTLSLEQELASLPPLRYIGKSPVLVLGQ